jgi:D-glycero-D-manno-heptose 1,7-bisphosphate phosphatase
MAAVPGALEAVARLNHAGWHVVVATNQSGIGRGMIDMAAVNAVHAHMNQQLMVHGGRMDAVFFCPHTPEDDCDCRKPSRACCWTSAAATAWTWPGADGGRHAARPAGRPPRRLPAAPGAFGRAASLGAEQTQALLDQVPGALVHDTCRTSPTICCQAAVRPTR